jgi:integrase
MKVDSGVAFGGGRHMLGRFQKRVGNIPLESIRETHIRSFLDDPPTGPNTRRGKYFYLFRFFQYCYARNYMPGIKMPENRSSRPTLYVPHIYTRLEIKRMLKALPNAQKDRKIECATFRALILFLYGTGATPSEALKLRCGDLDWKKRTVAIFTSKSDSYRHLPIGCELYSILRNYSKRSVRAAPDAPFFRYSGGGAITSETLHRNFAAIRQAAGISKPGGRRSQPRVLDLRHTFAVHRIETWFKHHADLNRLLPALSVYLGFASLSSAERYLRLTPDRFAAQLNLILPNRKHPKWKNSPVLMRFLDSL